MPESAYTVADQQRMTRATNYFDWQASLVLPHVGRRVVEVGCGIGNFTGRLLDREMVLAVDTDEGCLEQLRRRYPGVRTATAITGSGFDSCVCLNVLEHVEDDAGMLREMAAAMVPGGKIVLIVPAFQALYGPIDRHLGHFRRYTVASLRQLAASAGFDVRHTRYMNVPGFFGWWVNAKILKLEAQSEKQIGFFDRCIVPVISRMEALMYPPFGQSIFAVLEKPR